MWEDTGARLYSQDSATCEAFLALQAGQVVLTDGSMPLRFQWQISIALAYCFLLWG